MKLTKRTYEHEDLVAWKKSNQLTLEVFKTVNDVDPVMFEYMKESALRIVSKIAEGISKRTIANKITDLEDAKGASARLSTQLILSGQLEYLTKSRSEQLYAQTMEVYKVISGLIRYIEKAAQTKNATL
jgi:four helix bundle protein